MATPGEINDRLLVGYLPTYALVMVHVAFLAVGQELLILVFGSALAGVALFVAERFTISRSKHGKTQTLEISESDAPVKIALYCAIVYSGMVYAHFSGSYDSVANVSPVFAGMFSIRELLEKFRLRKLEQR